MTTFAGETIRLEIMNIQTEEPIEVFITRLNLVQNNENRYYTILG